MATERIDVRLQDALAAALAGLTGLTAEGRDPGCAACVVRDGRVVAHAWSGTTDGERAWAPDTLVMGYSVAKPLAALTVLAVVAEGRVGLDDPVATVWPAYGRHGKEVTTVRDVLAHRAGQPAFPEPATQIGYDDRAALLDLLASSEPQLPPGRSIAEHALTYGHLCGAVVEGATGEPLHERFGALARRFGWDLHLALEPGEHHRAADVEAVDSGWAQAYLDDPRWGPALGRPTGLLDPVVLNSARWRSTPFEAISLHGSAEGIARFYDDLTAVDGPVAGLLGRDLHAECVRAQAVGFDEVLGREVSWTLGSQLDDGELAMGGAGGCSGWTSYDHGYSAAFVTRGLGDHARGEVVWKAIGEVFAAGS